MQNVRELIKALDGPEAVSAALSAMSHKAVGDRAVEKWGDKNHVPYYWRPLLMDLSRRRGIDGADSLLSWSPSQAA